MRTLLPIAALIALLCTSVVWLGQPSEAATSSFGEAKVRLYSDGEVVGQWIAVGPGQVDAGSLVFPVRKGARVLEVRISGTYSFEQQP